MLRGTDREENQMITDAVPVGLLESFFEKNSTPMLISNLQSTILQCNRAACDLFDMDMNRIVGKKTCAILYEDNREEDNILREALENEGHAEQVLIRRDRRIKVSVDTIEAEDSSFAMYSLENDGARDDTEAVGCYCLSEQIILDVAAKLLEPSSSSDLFSIVGEAVQDVVGDSYVLINRCRKDTEETEIMYLGVPDADVLERLSHIFGGHLVGMRFPVSAQARKQMMSTRRLVDDISGIDKLSTSLVVNRLGKALENILRVNHIYGLGLFWNDELFGNVLIITKKKKRGFNASLVESLAHIASLAFQRKQTERALLESENKYRSLVDNLHEGIWHIDAEGRTAFANPCMGDMLGYTVEEMYGKHLFDFMDEQGVEIAKRGLGRGISGIREQHEFEFIRRDGKRIHVLMGTTSLKDDKGKIVGHLAGVLDLTPQKKVEEALRTRLEMESFSSAFSLRCISTDAEGLDEAIDEVLEGTGKLLGLDRTYIFRLDDEANIMSNTHEWCAQGIEPQIANLQKIPLESMTWWMEQMATRRTLHINRLRDLPPEANAEKELLDSQGILSVLTVPLFTSNRLLGFFGFDSVSHEREWSDDDVNFLEGLANNLSLVLDRIYMIEALRDSKEHYRKLAETNNAIIWEFSITDNRWTYVSPQAAEVTGWHSDEWTDMEFWLDRLHPDDREWAADYCNECTLRGEDHDFEYRFRKKDDSYIWIRDSVTVEMQSGKPLWLRGFMIDITERRSIEEDLRASLEEKETLVREVHHRVKNNMQIISSLLNLQAEHISDENTLGVFRDSISRIRTMALIHEKLYRTENIVSVNFSTYVKDMAAQLFRSYSVDGEQIIFEIEADDLFLEADEVIPLALIVNELVCNSLKHAFPHGQKGRIRFVLRQDGGLSFLEISDNGIGIPDDIDLFKSKTLGLQLVQSLATQAGCTLEIGKEGGTSFRFTFTRKLGQREESH